MDSEIARAGGLDGIDTLIGIVSQAATLQTMLVQRSLKQRTVKVAPYHPC